MKMEDIGKIVDVLKIQLNTDKSQSRAETISYLLEVLRSNEEECLITYLVYNGIISDLIQNVNLLSRRDILECLQIIVKTNAFYTNGLVDETIQGITKYQLINSIEEAALAVDVILSIVTKVFVDFTESRGILLINKHEEGLLNFIERAVFNSFSILSATKLLNFLLKYSSDNFSYTNIKNINIIYDEVMVFLKTAEDISNLEKLKIICCTSLSLVNFCNKIDEKEIENKLSGSSAASSILQIPEIKNGLIESIRRITQEFLIPFPKTVYQFDIVDLLVEFLQAVIKIRVINDEKICVDMLSQGYLKYFMDLSVFHHKKNRICCLMSEIIVTLSEYLELPIDNWPGGLVAFQIFLRNGFESIPIDPKRWEDCLKSHSCQANSLLILLSCHYLGTKEIHVVTQKALAVKLTSVVEQCSEPIFLKAIWLLFSATALASKIPISNHRCCSKAIKCLAIFLEKQQNIELAYTHIVDLFLYAITETNFPEKLKVKTISLWLDNCKNDEECDMFIQECLAQKYSELKIVEQLMVIIHESDMKYPNNALNTYISLLKYKQAVPEEVIDLVWKTLADDLSHYTPTKSEIVKTVLYFAGTLPTSKHVSAKIIRKCATEICKVLLKEGATDMTLKTSLITTAAFTIRQSVDLQDSKVSEIYLRNDQFLIEVYNGAFSSSENLMTEMSLRTLTCLMLCQILYRIPSYTISEITFEELKLLLLRIQKNECSITFGIEFVKFILRNRIDYPIIGLKKADCDSDIQNIYFIYLFIHFIHSETAHEKEGQIYQCLSTILNYCSQEKLDLSGFLLCPSTHFLIEKVAMDLFTTKEINYHFLNFAVVWLDYLKLHESEGHQKNKKEIRQSITLLTHMIPFLMDLDIGNVAVYNFIKMVQTYVA